MSKEQDVLGGSGALAELAGPLKDFFEKLSGSNGELWLAGFKKFLRKENFWDSVVLRVDRAKPFDLVAFLGKGWKIVEQDERALVIAELEISKIQLSHCLKEGESVINGEERLNRLKTTNNIRLDAKVFQAFWEDQKMIPESWKKEEQRISFDGTIISRRPQWQGDDDRRMFCLQWRNGVWNWSALQIVGGWTRKNPSALLASIS